MKKMVSVVLAMVLMLTMSVSVFAAPGQFVKSPSLNDSVILISFDRGSEDCTGDLIVTPYKERATLPADLKTLIEKAYGDIAASKDLSTLNADLAAVAAAKDIAGTDLKVSDLFDVRYEGCTNHGEGHSFDIIVKANTLHRFVGLLHMNQNGEWELIENAKVINNGEHLSFSVDSLSPFAVVVDTSEADGDSPVTGIHNEIIIYGILMLVSALAVVALIAKGKKYA